MASEPTPNRDEPQGHEHSLEDEYDAMLEEVAEDRYHDDVSEMGSPEVL